jgi:hypothetical protein
VRSAICATTSSGNPDQLALLPDNPGGQRQELELCSALGAVLQAVKGYAAPETGHAHARARELWEQLGSPTEFLQIPYGQSRYHVGRGDFDLAQRLDEDLLRVSGCRNESKIHSCTPLVAKTCDPLIKSQNYCIDSARLFSQLGAKAPITNQRVTLKFPTEKAPNLQPFARIIRPPKPPPWPPCPSTTPAPNSASLPPGRQASASSPARPSGSCKASYPRGPIAP